ncbi:MAG: Ig-like domain-containing protein [Bacteroidales bacterium]|nr:Ig-like domain-containing protein [Bacteroidales bacterium]
MQGSPGTAKENHGFNRKNKAHRIFCLYVSIVFTMLLSGCAQVGAPTGGPKDTTPPAVLKSEPENRSVYFSGNEIEILFDEYIVLKNLNSELIVSPPLGNRLDVRVRNKTILINLNNELLQNTTYTLNFGNAITDNNEGNALTDFEFVFSTGGTIDSLAITGTALAAVDHKPPQEDEYVYVMLYEDPGDSVPLLELPRYLGRINQNGNFVVNNIHSGTYRVIALKDMDRDLIYDPITDAIGLADTLVVIGPETVEEIHVITDTIQTSDTIREEGFLLQAVRQELYYFHEESGKVFLNSRSRESPQEVFLTFTRPPYDSVSIKFLNFTPDSNWFAVQYSSYMDSIRFWITDTSISSMESINLELSFLTKDTADQFIIQRDTVQLVYKPAERGGAAGRRLSDDVRPQGDTRLRLSSATGNNRSIDLNSTIRYTAVTPLEKIDPGRIELTRTIDSIEYDQEFTVLRDSADIRRFMISANWQEESRYSLILLPGAVTDIYGLKNDSVRLNFSTLQENYYTNLQVTIESIHLPLILQLMNEKEQVVRQRYIGKEGKITLDYLAPGTYSLKAIHDRNQNGKWDTGNYFKRIQPEAVFYYKTMTETRSNWDYEILWQISD